MLSLWGCIFEHSFVRKLVMAKPKNPPQNAVGTTNGVLRNTEETIDRGGCSKLWETLRVLGATPSSDVSGNEGHNRSAFIVSNSARVISPRSRRSPSFASSSEVFAIGFEPFRTDEDLAALTKSFRLDCFRYKTPTIRNYFSQHSSRTLTESDAWATRVTAKCGLV